MSCQWLLTFVDEVIVQARLQLFEGGAQVVEDHARSELLLARLSGRVVAGRTQLVRALQKLLRLVRGDLLEVATLLQRRPLKQTDTGSDRPLSKINAALLCCSAFRLQFIRFQNIGQLAL